MNTGFDEHAEQYDAWFLDNKNVLYSEVRLVAKVLEGAGKILSVGCGSGLFEKILREEFAIDIRDGIEPSGDMAAIAEKRGIRVKKTTAENADFGKDEFDTILFNGSPGYISRLGDVVEKAYGALPKNGRLILIDIPKESGYGLLYNLAKTLGTWQNLLLEGCFPPTPYPIELVDQAHWRTTAEKTEIMKEVGFSDISYFQTLCSSPVFSNNEIEDPREGFTCGDYVAVTGWKR